MKSTPDTILMRSHPLQGQLLRGFLVGRDDRKREMDLNKAKCWSSQISSHYTKTIGVMLYPAQSKCSARWNMILSGQSRK